MKRIILALLSVGLVTSVGVDAATVTVSGGTGLQAAIDGANAGDTVEITDSMTYNEDIFIGPGKDGLILIGTAVNPPTILAANNTIHSAASPDVAARGLVGAIMGVASGLLAGGGPLPDQLGLLVEANDVTLENLIIQNDGPSASPDLFTSACNIVGDDTTITDCVLRGGIQATAADNEFCVSWTSGNWPELDAALAFVSLPDYFSNAGYSTTVRSERTVMNNCTLERGTNCFAGGDYSQFFYNAITASYLNSVIPFNIVLNDCTFTNAGDGEILEAGGIDNVVMNNCLFDQNEGELHIGGGQWVFNSCVITSASADTNGIPDDGDQGRMVDQGSIVEFGGGAADTTWNECFFCGQAFDGGELIRIEEGNATFSRCVFNAQAPNDWVILWNCDEYDGQFTDALNNAGLNIFPAVTTLTVDRCDIYKPGSTPEARPAIHYRATEGSDPNEPTANLVVTNSIITTDGVGVETSGNVPTGGGSITVTNNDFLNGGADEVLNNIPVTETIVDNLSNVAPGYANIGGCTPADYVYANPALETASTSGGPIGSQDPVFDVITDSVLDWKLYE